MIFESNVKYPKKSLDADTTLDMVGSGVYSVVRDGVKYIVAKINNSQDALVLAGNLHIIDSDDFPYYLVEDAQISAEFRIKPLKWV